ncbi:MAG: superoxide dismutase family protein [Pseudonocardiaceae bacterium]
MGITLSQLDTACSTAGRPVSRSWPIGRRLTVAAAGVAVALGPIGCSSEESSNPPAPAPTTTSEATAAVELSASGTLAAPDKASNAFTYDPALAPPGAQLSVTLTPSDGSTTAEFDASGLLPNRGYAVHLHTKPCGPTGDAAGPHFQYRVDPAATPEQPSTDPEYANPDNEVWLDLRTDATGSATASTEVPFTFTDRAPASVVVHEEMATATEPGQAGTAGDRVACLTLPKQ